MAGRAKTEPHTEPITLADLAGKPGHLIRRLQQIAVAIFMEECADYDITPVQYAALVAIRDNPGFDATRIAALIAFDRATLGNVLERLEAKGTLARRASDTDKRVKELKLTAKGDKLLRDVEPAVARAQDRIVAPLSSPDRHRLLKTLDVLVKAAESKD
jgi:MarR family transcriptional regulator, lower aerobic nicotinate degradation pathway regulator